MGEKKLKLNPDMEKQAFGQQETGLRHCNWVCSLQVCPSSIRALGRKETSKVENYASSTVIRKNSNNAKMNQQEI